VFSANNEGRRYFCPLISSVKCESFMYSLSLLTVKYSIHLIMYVCLQASWGAGGGGRGWFELTQYPFTGSGFPLILNKSLACTITK
jgi:hypothetical protein